MSEMPKYMHPCFRTLNPKCSKLSKQHLSNSDERQSSKPGVERMIVQWSKSAPNESPRQKQSEILRTRLNASILRCTRGANTQSRNQPSTLPFQPRKSCVAMISGNPSAPRSMCVRRWWTSHDLRHSRYSTRAFEQSVLQSSDNAAGRFVQESGTWCFCFCVFLWFLAGCAEV